LKNKIVCPSQHIQFEIGFQIPSIFGSFLPLIDLCHHLPSGSTLYAKHTVYGQSVKHSMPTFTGGTFRTDFLDPVFTNGAVKIADSYTIATQKKTFPGKIGDLATQMYYAKGHLNPNNDALFRSWGDATYYYMNTVPQWQAINNGNWKRIEVAVQAEADRIRNNVEVFSGGFYQTNLKLHPSGVKIPTWTYKVVVRPAVVAGGISFQRAGIALLTLNDVYATTATKPNNPCVDLCEHLGWLKGEDRINFLKGYTICCSVSDFQNKVQSLGILVLFNNLEILRADSTSE
jgi:DNA/RNA non-specific endonuclease